MRIISRRALVTFWDKEPHAKGTLQAWYAVLKGADIENFGQLKELFRSADKVGRHIVFNIGGHKYRLIVIVKFKYRTIYIRAVLTHKQYDEDFWKNE